MKKILLILSNSLIITSDININLSSKNYINKNGFESGKKIDIKVSPGKSLGGKGKYELINYGKSGYDTFDNYVKAHQYYSDPSYYLIGKIGAAAKWHIETTWLAEPQKTSYIKEMIDKKTFKDIIKIFWNSSNDKRTTYLKVVESFYDLPSTKTIYIYWGYYAANQNKTENTQFQAYL